MATRTLTGFFGDAFHREPSAVPIHPVERRRRTTALALIVATLVLGVVFMAVWGTETLAVFLPGLPMAFILLWGSTSALRFDEQEEQASEGEGSVTTSAAAAV